MSNTMLQVNSGEVTAHCPYHQMCITIVQHLWAMRVFIQLYQPCVDPLFYPVYTPIASPMQPCSTPLARPWAASNPRSPPLRSNPVHPCSTPVQPLFHPCGFKVMMTLCCCELEPHCVGARHIKITAK